MFTKTKKSFVLLGGLLVFSFLLASCQSTGTSNEEMERSRVIDAWGANLTAQGESYLEEMERSRVVEAWGANLTAQGERYLEEMNRQKAVDAWGANLTAQGERYFGEMESNRVVEAWAANLTAQGARYLEEMAQANVPWIELRSDVPAPATEQSSSVALIELRSDVPAPRTEAMIDATNPGVGIQRMWMYERTFSTAYTVMSNRPVWVVFHADQDGLAGEILQHIFVGSGTNKIVRTENLGEMSSKQIHVMLHEDLGRIGLFEFPGSDSPVFVEDEIVNELCFCPF